MLATIVNKMRLLISDDDGHVLIEYGLILALIAIACITVVGEIGNKVGNFFTRAASSYP